MSSSDKTFKPDYGLRGPFRRLRRANPQRLVIGAALVAFAGLLVGMLRAWW